jgi:regulator of sigma E protease
MLTIIIFLIVLAILVLVHEFGHFIVAKKSGIRVDEFGLGFPPKLWGKKWNGTLYSINAIPFGGFVKIFGEDAHTEAISEIDRDTSFISKPKWIQVLVLAAGVTFNIVFAWLLLSLGFMIGLPTPDSYSGLGKVTNTHVTITEVLTNSPAEKSGLRPGDKINSVSIGHIALTGDTLSPDNIEHAISESTMGDVEVSYTRGNDPPNSVSISPNTDVVPGKRAIGIATDNIGILKLSLPNALIEGTKTTWYLISGTAIGLLKFIWNIIIFKSDFSQVSGPVGIASVVGEAQHLGFVYLLSLMALISINLAIINLIPFPALDGGRIAMVIIEKIIRRPIPPKVVSWVNNVGFTLLIILMIVVTTHDILRLL